MDNEFLVNNSSEHNAGKDLKTPQKIFDFAGKVLECGRRMQNGRITELLEEYAAKDNRAALDELLPLVYDELRRIAASYLRRENAIHTLQPTALVHEAYMRLVGQKNVDWQNRAQFFGLAANMMRRILVNHAEARRAEKRGGNVARLELNETMIEVDSQNLDLLALNEALEKLAKLDKQKVHIVELKFFGGLTTEEIAAVVGKSDATIEREWSFARAWLRKEMRK